MIRETISPNIRRIECRKTGVIRYEGRKFERCKIFDTEKEAKKYVDFICLEKGVSQVYNSYTRKN